MVINQIIGGVVWTGPNGQNYSSPQLSNIFEGAEKELKTEVQRTKRKRETTLTVLQQHTEH